MKFTKHWHYIVLIAIFYGVINFGDNSILLSIGLIGLLFSVIFWMVKLIKDVKKVNEKISEIKTKEKNVKVKEDKKHKEEWARNMKFIRPILIILFIIFIVWIISLPEPERSSRIQASILPLAIAIVMILYSTLKEKFNKRKKR